MNTDPDLPDVSSFSSSSSRVTSVSGVKPLKGFVGSDADKKKHRRATEMDFRKKLQAAILVLQEREARHEMGFEMVELDGELAVTVLDATGESIGLMMADDAISRADSGDETAFFIDREC